MPLSIVGIFYGVMAALAALLCWWLGLPMFERPAAQGADATMALWRAAGIGVGAGLVVVALSQLIERFTRWGRRLHEGLKSLIGETTLWGVAVMACCSSIAEELLFRSFLQQVLELKLLSSLGAPTPIILSILISGVIFGLVHIGPDWRTFWPWTVMAVVMGWALGALFVWTGSIWAPIATHFTINAINLALMVTQRPDDADA